FTQLRDRGADRRHRGAANGVGVQAALGVAEARARQRRVTMILLPYLAKATLIISAAAAMLALDRRSSAAFRHLICAVAIGGFLGLPILSSALPAWDLSGPPKFGHYDLSGPPEG